MPKKSVNAMHIIGAAALAVSATFSGIAYADPLAVEATMFGKS